ncbi:hypothetical protein [Foetidibacter luteolus]|uniref:hypothetical protein n=1 Tax=Foetidibacter luteolus TaxID=2608880 RepID=UPI00129B9992|nr:hypothetical protein [Foetidibacter luteolus]
MKPFITSIAVALLFVVLYSCAGSSKSSGRTVTAFGPGSSPDTISVPATGSARYIVIKKIGGPGSSPDTISVKANERVVIYQTKEKPKDPKKKDE